MDETAMTYIQTLEQTVQKMEATIRELVGGLKDIKFGIPAMKATIESKRQMPTFAKELKERNEKQLAAAETEKKKLENEKQTLEGELSKVQTKMGKKDEDLKAVSSKLRQTEQELQRTQTRLSEIMGNKLINNNPGIADLSDPNRPSKLADKYSELYDNEWTDAYELIQSVKGCDDKECVRILLTLLESISGFCTERWKIYVNNFQEGMQRGKKFDMPDYITKQIKDIAKYAAPNMVDDVLKELIEECKNVGEDNRFLFESRRMKPYLEVCVEICWLMAAQDPPVIFKTGFKRMDQFDNNFFKAYTQSGDTIDYIVWLPLLLHEGGPLLAKGVAQAVRTKERAKSAPARNRGNFEGTGDRSSSRTQGNNPKVAWPVNDGYPTATNQPQPGDASTSPQSALGDLNYQQTTVKNNAVSHSNYTVSSQQLGTNYWQLNNQQPVFSTDVTNTSQPSNDRVQTPMDQSQPYGNRQSTYSGNNSQQPLASHDQWKHQIIPSQEQMDRFMECMYYRNYGEKSTRNIIGDGIFELCRDYKMYQENKLMS